MGLSRVGGGLLGGNILRYVAGWNLCLILPCILVSNLDTGSTIASIPKSTHPVPIKPSVPSVTQKTGESNAYADARNSPIPKRYKQIIDLEGKPGEGYYLTVLIGTPPQKLRVLIDTGSSNFGVAVYNLSKENSYFHINNSTTFESYNVSVEVPYTQGSWMGSLGSDIVAFPSQSNTWPKLPPIRSKLSLIEHSENFFIQTAMWEGILGLAYPRLAKPYSNVLSPYDQYIVEGYIDDVFSMQLCFNVKQSSRQPTIARSQLSGSLVLGGIEESMYTGEIFYTPIIRRWYYEVVLTSIKVDNHTLPLDCSVFNKERTIIDTGTTNLRLEQGAFEQLVEHLKKYQKLGEIPDDFWHGRQFMCWEKSSLAYFYLPTIELSLLSTTGSFQDFQLHITPQMYLREILDNLIDDTQSCYRFAVSASEKTSVIGAVVLEGFYVIFDRENDRIGFAVTKCGDNGRKNFQSDITGPTLHTYNLRNCYKNYEVDFTVSQLSYIVFTMLTLMLLTSLPLIIYLIIELSPKIQ